MSATQPRQDNRRPGELTPLELVRWTWRQLTSMRTALVLLLLLALGAVPGSVIPQKGVDALKTSRWQDQHPTLTPIYDRLGLFGVYHSAWFSSIYLLLMISLMGCIVPRLFIYWRGLRARPPDAPRNLSRMPDHTAYDSDEAPEDVLDQAATVLRKRRFRISTGDGWVAAERGYLREAGNLLFHLSVLVVLVGFGYQSLFGYKGGVILVVGNGFSNNLTQYDDFAPGGLFDASKMEPFSFRVNDFKVDWINSGPRQGMARGFKAFMTYRTSPSAPEQSYDLRVNHPLSIGGTQIFLIGHGYAPVVTIRDGSGHIAYSGPTIFLPENSNFLSFGVVKAPDAQPKGIGLEGLFYPTYLNVKGDPINVMGDLKNPTLSLLAYTGDLGMDNGTAQSVYVLDKSHATLLKKPDGKMFRVDLQRGQSIDLPQHAGTVTFDGVDRWNRIQISRTPGTWLTLGGVLSALLGMLGSLFIRPRRVWVRVRRDNGGPARVELAGLDRNDGGDVAAELSEIVAQLGIRSPEPVTAGTKEST